MHKLDLFILSRLMVKRIVSAYCINLYSTVDTYLFLFMIIVSAFSDVYLAFSAPFTDKTSEAIYWAQQDDCECLFYECLNCQA